MAEAVYILCALTSLACAVLLFRAFARSGTRFLLWSGLCFAWLTANNVLLMLERVFIRDIDLTLVRTATSLIAVLFLVYGLIWDSE